MIHNITWCIDIFTDHISFSDRKLWCFICHRISCQTTCHLNVKIPSYQYRKPHSKDNTIVKSPFPYKGILILARCLFWITFVLNQSPGFVFIQSLTTVSPCQGKTLYAFSLIGIIFSHMQKTGTVHTYRYPIILTLKSVILIRYLISYILEKLLNFYTNYALTSISPPGDSEQTIDSLK